jgi:glycine cleavage system H protein
VSENIPKDLRYTKDHAWVRTLGPGAAEVGITDHAQGLLGDMVSTDLPAIGATVQAGVKAAVVESNKAASDVESPVSGKVTANNTELAATPTLINDDPYTKGWLYRVELTSQPTDLLSAADYEKLLAQ